MWNLIESDKDQHGFTISETWSFIKDGYEGIVFKKVGYRTSWNLSHENKGGSSLAKGSIDTEELRKTAEEKIEVAISTCKLIVEFHYELFKEEAL